VTTSVVARLALCAGFAGVIAAVATGCTNSESSLGKISVVPPMNATIRFSADVQPIFNQNCAFAGCHGSASPAQGLVLESGKAYQNLVNVPVVEFPGPIRVVPGNSAMSYLVGKLEGTAFGDRMPDQLPPLPEAEIQIIKDWIDQGAADN